MTLLGVRARPWETSAYPWRVLLSSSERLLLQRLAFVATRYFPARKEEGRGDAERLAHAYWGFASEYALHLRTGATWFAGNRYFTAPTDVGPYQVKSTGKPAPDRDRHHLVIPPGANGVTPFIFAVVLENGVEFRGWRYGREGPVHGRWKDDLLFPPTGYWIKQDALDLMARLPAAAIRRAPTPDLLAPRPGDDVPADLETVLQGGPLPEAFARMARRLVNVAQAEGIRIPTTRLPTVAPPPPKEPVLVITPRSLVRHPLHGTGRVHDLRLHRNKREAWVDFDDAGRRLVLFDELTLVRQAGDARS